MKRAGSILTITWVAISLAACATGPSSMLSSEARDERIDVAIITVLPQEYAAVLKKLENVRRVLEPGGDPNVYAWALGEIRSAEREKPRRLVVAMAGEAGEVSGALATTATIDRFKPRDVLLVGIAGGIGESVELGDVVISSRIWGYEHGHLGKRYDSAGVFFFQSDSILVTAARDLGDGWRQKIETRAPVRNVTPAVVEGKTASGNKVIENSSSAYFAQTLHPDSSILSVDMEGVGAAAAIGRDHDAGGTTGFLMIRGISDLVEREGDKEDPLPERGRNPERDVWKRYAADVAASFAVYLIETSWPD